MQVGIEHTYGQICVDNGVSLKSKLFDTLERDRLHYEPPRRLCHGPAIFFRHLPLITLSFPQGKIVGHVLKMPLLDFFFFSNRVGR